MTSCKPFYCDRLRHGNDTIPAVSRFVINSRRCVQIRRDSCELPRRTDARRDPALLQTEQPFGFAEDELGVHEGFIADVLPAEAARAVDHERAVQGAVLEVVEGPVGPEGLVLAVREEQ